MIVYITLLAAVGFEVAGTILLPLTRNFSKPLPSLFLQFFYGYPLLSQIRLLVFQIEKSNRR